MKKLLIPLMALMLIASVAATPLAIIQSEYVKFDPTLIEPAFSVLVRGDNSPSYIVFATPEQITGTKDGTSVRAEDGFKLETEIVSESCDYALTKSTTMNPIYQYRLEKEATGAQLWNVDSLQENCELKGSIFNYAIKRFVTVWPVYDVFCVYKDKSATVGSVGEGIMNFQAKFTLTKDGSTPIIKTISSIAKSKSGIPPSVTFTENNKPVAIATWRGGVTYGEFCPSQDNLYAIQAKENIWYTGSTFNYNLYNTQYTQTETLLDSLEAKQSSSGSALLTSTDIANLNASINSNNARANTALNEDNIRTSNEHATFNGASASIALGRDHLIYAPDFQIFLKASWLNLVYLTGKPKITASSFANCVEGAKENQITVTIKNTGAASGQFLGGVSCDPGIKIDTAQRSITLKAGESGTLAFPFTIDLSQDAKRSCTVNVQDALNTANKDTATVVTNCAAERFCEVEGLKKCVGETEFQCTGGQLIKTDSTACRTSTCNRDSVCDTDSGESFEVCGGKSASNNDCAVCNFDDVCDATETIYKCPVDCGMNPPTTSIWIYVLGGIVAAVGVYAVGSYIKNPKKKGLKRRKR